MISAEAILRKEVPKLFRYPNWIKKGIIGLARRVLHEKSINRFMEENQEKIEVEFVDTVLEYLNVSYKTVHKQIENISSIGKVIIVANHPLGALDALCLIQMICSVRQDKKVKIIANRILGEITQLKEFLISVDNFNDRVSKHALRQIDQALKAEEAVIFFPSGEVSRAGMFGLKEGGWKGGFLKFAKRNAAPILQTIFEEKTVLYFMRFHGFINLWGHSY